MSAPLRILLIDDDAADRLAVRRALGRAGLEVELIEAADGASGVEQYRESTFDCVLLDHCLPDADGPTVLQRLKAHGQPYPVILMLTGHGSESLAFETMHAGAMDYLEKETIEPSTLKRAIQYAIARRGSLNAEIEARELLERKNRELAELYRTAHKFVDNVSHEFRTPLTVIKEYAAIVREGLMGPINDDQAELLDVVLHRTEDLAIMVADMLDISKLETGLLSVWRRSCPVQEVVRHSWDMLESRAQAAKGSLEVDVPADLPNVFCDPEKLSRVVTNLAVNAFKFSEEGGRVRVWARLETPRGHVRIGVTDDGPGIAPENLQEIFERFRQVGGHVAASTKGFGLGLSIAKELVQLNLGTITVESRPGEGSTFSFTAPEAELGIVIRNHLRLVGQTRTESRHLALLHLAVPATTAIGLLEEIDQFLPRQLRHTDLICRVQLHAWIVVVAGETADPAPALERLERSRRSANRNRIGAPIPAITSEALAHGSLDDPAGCANLFICTLAGLATPSMPLALVA